jgi:hypothetical protein
MALITKLGVDDELLAWANCNIGGDTFQNTGRESLVFYSGSGTRTVTIVATSAYGCPDGELHDHVLTLTVSQYKWVSFVHLPPARFNDADGLTSITYDAVGGLQVVCKQEFE